MRKNILIISLLFLSIGVQASLFTAQDKAFSIDLPSQWKQVLDDKTALSLKKDRATLTVKNITPCEDVKCLEKKVKAEISILKESKFKILQNTYSGETVKQTDFSTGDPLLSFNFSGMGADFTYGYFLADGKTFKIEIKGIPYVEADLAMSFIAPRPKPMVKANHTPLAEDNIPLMEDVETPIIETTTQDEGISLPSEAPDAQEGLEVDAQEEEEEETSVSPFTLAQKPINFTLNKYTITILIILVYLLLVVSFYTYNFFFSARDIKVRMNPKSPYPIQAKRLYGSPDLFFRLYDNQGMNFIATSARWGSIFIGIGIITIILFLCGRFTFAFLIDNGFRIHQVIANTVLSLCYLFTLFGGIMIVAGLLAKILFAAKIFIYTNRGKILFKIKRKGFGVFKEEYLAFNPEGTLIFKTRRTKFLLRRNWDIYDQQGLLAHVQETSILRSILRKFFGHLGGTLRASYKISAKNDSNGVITSFRCITTSFKVDLDKPEAVPSNIMIAAAGIIFLRDKDKPYPWFN